MQKELAALLDAISMKVGNAMSDNVPEDLRKLADDLAILQNTVTNRCSRMQGVLNAQAFGRK